LFYAILDKHRQGYYGKHMLTLLNNSTQVYVKVNKGKYDGLRNEPQIVSFKYIYNSRNALWEDIHNISLIDTTKLTEVIPISFQTFKFF
jgi:hypothetical protein